MILPISYAVRTVLVACLAVCSWVTASKPMFAQPARPLDGRANVVAPAIAAGLAAGTVVEVRQDDQVLSTRSGSIVMRLPPDAVAANGNVSVLALAPSQSLVIDPDRGSWYSFVDRRDGYTLTVEGDDRLLVSARGCQTRDERTAYLGSADKKAASLADQDEGPTKEIVFVDDCTPYRAVVECVGDKRIDKTNCAAAKRDLDEGFRRKLAAVRTLRISAGDAQRSLLPPGAAAAIIPPVPRPPGSASEFKYYEPGQQRVRQYRAPANCGQVAKGVEFAVDRRTPYSRLVFAAPNSFKRFPIVLPADKSAHANSQIFNPGGTFFVTPKATGVGEDFLKDDCERRHPKRTRPALDQSWGEMGPDNYDDPRNFKMPWSDTFCEWRGNGFTQPFCAARGERAKKGPHYGVDIRSWTQAKDQRVSIVSASDGIVTEVGTKDRPNHAPYKGFVIKVRSQHLIFVYRHMEPELSPFRDGVADRLRLGDRVAAGQLIGFMGDFMDGPAGTTKHLHFEIETPVPKSVLLGPVCLFERDGKTIRVCLAREKAPPLPTLIVSYLWERYGESVNLSTIDNLTGLPVLPVLPAHQITVPPAPAGIALAIE